MAAYDSIVNVEEWISDHYFTTDETKGASFGKRTAGRIKEWKNEVEDYNPWFRFSSQRQSLQMTLSTLDADDLAALNTAATMVRSALGYGRPEPHTFRRGKNCYLIDAWVGDSGSVIAFDSHAIASHEELSDTTPLGSITLNDKLQKWSTHKTISELFLSDIPPHFVIVTAGHWVILAEREGWPLGRYLAIDLNLAIERNDQKSKGELQRIAVILSRENTERTADDTTWWTTTMEESLNHAVQVSAELRGAVKTSIEIIGNDVLDRHREQNLPITDIIGNELAKQSLRYLYRILFLLFSEARPELEILPTGAQEYDQGYGLARIRDLILNEPATSRASHGTHLYSSLNVLFQLINNGHDPEEHHIHGQGAPGLRFRELSADLFLPEKTSYIDRVKLSNLALHKVLQNLLLSKEKRGRDRGFISYATLGVSELGQVYEGLMSYRGFIAEEELFEVAPNGDATKGSWVVPRHRTEGLESHLVKVTVAAAEGGTILKNKVYPTGSFVFRQSSRDRQRSASFYTPPVLTEFTVSQALEELEASGRISCADDILDISICEPAMGSGAFAVEAVRQLAELYLRRKEQERDEQIPATDRTVELQKTKAYIALHNVYGVDLNATAVELAEISLWLDTMTAELKAPWFGLHLRRGNSLIGASRATYSTVNLKNHKWLDMVPKRHPIADLAAAMDQLNQDPQTAGRIHHFLLPSKTWGSAADAKDLKSFAIEQQKLLKNWRNSIRHSPTTAQTKTLSMLGYRVEILWQSALQRLRIAEEQSRRTITLWGADHTTSTPVVKRAQIEEELFANPDSPYNRLRLVMDAWCALSFWPVTEAANAPLFDAWLAALQDILGMHSKAFINKQTLASVTDWDDLTDVEVQDLQFAGALSIAECLEKHPWLETVKEIAAEQGFFHWDLDFAAIFAKGGFDLQIGNPPWVRPDVNFDQLLAEYDPWWQLAHKPTQKGKNERLAAIIDEPIVRRTVAKGVGEAVGLAAVLGSIAHYPYLKDQRPDLYRGFIERTWENMSPNGVVSLIHPKTHCTEADAASLRKVAYQRLHRNWHITNKLRLFDIDANEKNFDVAIYGPPKDTISFLMCSGVHHPKTIIGSLQHDGSGLAPSFKTDSGEWDLRPHRDRIIHVDNSVLKVWKSILEEPDTPLLETRMVYTVNTEAAQVLAKLAAAPRIKELGLQFSGGWNETTDKKKGYFDVGWKHPESWNKVILQGPHLGVSLPMQKQPNPTMKHNQDWSEIDLEALSEDFIPATAYQPAEMDNELYVNTYGTWNNTPIAETYRVAWRKMAATTGYRTLYPALIPPGSTHIDGIESGGPIHTLKDVAGAAFSSSLLLDFMIRSTGIANIRGALFERLPLGNVQDPHVNTAVRLWLRLNCVTRVYAPLWEDITGEPWTMNTPLRNAQQRWQAQNTIDVIVAHSLGITIDELCMIYRTQFPVMRRYDQEHLYDSNGRKVPADIVKQHNKLPEGTLLTKEQRTWTHPQSTITYTFEYPFNPLNRETNLNKVYSQIASDKV